MLRRAVLEGVDRDMSKAFTVPHPMSGIDIYVLYLHTLSPELYTVYGMLCNMSCERPFLTIGPMRRSAVRGRP